MKRWLKLVITTTILIFQVKSVRCLFGFSKKLSLDAFPNPTDDYATCGRPQQSFICDPDKLINSESLVSLNLESFGEFNFSQILTYDQYRIRPCR